MGWFRKVLSAYRPVPRSRVEASGEVSPAPVEIEFRVRAEAEWGDRIVVVGSLRELGGWDPKRGLALDPASYPDWTVKVRLPADTPFEYKYVRQTAESSLRWEGGENREGQTPERGRGFREDVWR